MKRGPVRYEITGTWSGYTPSQKHVVHREYTINRRFADAVKALGTIAFTDGTQLMLRTRLMEYREKRGKEVNGYRSLIRDCIHYGVASVADLPKANKGELA